MKIIRCFYLLFLIPFILYAQNDALTDALYSNINILSEKIGTLSTKIKYLTGKIEKSNKDFHDLIIVDNSRIDSIKSELENEGKRIYELKDLIVMVNAGSIQNTKNIALVSSELEKIKVNIEKNEIEFNKISSRLAPLEEKVEKLDNFIFCNDCYPKFSFSLSLKYFFESMPSPIKKPLSVAGSFNFNINKKFSAWLDISAPFEFVTSNTYSGDTIQPEPTWTTYFGSYGIMYNIYSKNNFNFNAGLGLFHGKISLKDNLYNVTNTNNSIYPFGLSEKLELSYINKLGNRNISELFLDFTGYLTTTKIVLNSQFSKEINLGVFLLSTSIGYRINFW